MNAFNPLTSLISEAKSVLEGNWSDYVKDAFENLGVVVKDLEDKLSAFAIEADSMQVCYDTLQNAIAQVMVDEVWTMADALSIFINYPEDISESNPCFGITSHLGYGNEMGQYPTSQLRALTALYEEVLAMLDACDKGEITAVECCEYVNIITLAIENCKKAINGLNELPCSWISVPSENDANVPYSSEQSYSDPYIISQFTKSHADDATNCFRMESPIFSSMHEFTKIVLTVTNTFCSGCGSATNGFAGSDLTDGPFFNVSEMYLYDADGNEIELNGDQITTNGALTVAGWGGPEIVDRKMNTYFHTRWASAVSGTGNHTIEISLSNPMRAFKVAFENLTTSNRIRLNPSRFEVAVQSEGQYSLMDAIRLAGQYAQIPGDEVGYYSNPNYDFNKALERALQVEADPLATEAELLAAANELYVQCEINESMTYNKPLPGVEYYFTCGYPGYTNNQSVLKSLSVMQDSILWWENCDTENACQRFTFEPVEADNAEDTRDYYYIKNVGTGKYLSQFVKEGEAWEPTGEPITWGNPAYVKLGTEPCKWRIDALGDEQFGLFTYCHEAGAWYQCHTVNHNSGKATTTAGKAGGGKSTVNPDGYSIQGVSGPIGAYTYTKNSGSSWYIRPCIENLPTQLNVDKGENTRCHHFAAGGSTFSLKSDKNCAFDNIHFFNMHMKEMDCTVERFPNGLIVTFGNNICDFGFTFDNKEGVTTIEVALASQSVNKLSELKKVYDEVYTEYESGTEIGFVKDLTDYNAAIERAEQLLANGGTDEEIQAAIDALYAAHDGIEIRLPVAGQRYFIVGGYSGFYNNYGREVAMYYNTPNDRPGWTFLETSSENFMWEFEPADEEGIFRIKNVACGKYMNTNGSDVVLTDSAALYDLVSMDAGKVAIHSVALGTASSSNFHMSGHASGAGKFGPIIYWSTTECSRWYIRSVEYYLPDNIQTTELTPNIPIEGIYDMTGRRVYNPTTGLYIVNGKKVLFR